VNPSGEIVVRPLPPPRRGITLRWLLGFLCLLVLASVVLDWLEATNKVDRLIHDGWVRLERRTPPDDIVIAAIDARSLTALGRWPWSRERQALVLEQLAALGARAVVIDVLHVEPAARAESDTRLAEAIAGLPVSILPVLIEHGAGRAPDERLPLPVFSRVVSDLGHIVLPIDDDGIVRRMHLKVGFGEPHWPALSLAALAALEPDSPALAALPGDRLGERGPSHLWTRDHEVLVPFVGPSGSFRQVSASRIARGEVAREEIEGRIVFFGLATTGLGDVVPTPVSALERPMSGVEMHANVFTALRDGTLVTRAPTWTGPLAALLVLPLMLLLYSRAAPRWSLPGALVGALLPILASFLLYRYGRLWFAPLSASVPILASYLLWSRHRLEFVNRFLEREQAKLVPHLPRRQSNDLALATFFENAMRHLPLSGWRFATREVNFDGGDLSSLDRREIPPGRWMAQGSVHSKRYRTADQLRIDVVVEDSVRAREITAYVDSLSRVRSRTQPARASGTVERLQGNAERLREQMAWLRGVKTFSEALLAGGPIGFVVWNAAGEWVRGNDLVREMLPALTERALLIDFMREAGHEPGTLDDADERRRANRRRFDQLLLEGQSWQLAHEIDERALVINLSALGDRLSRRLICASVIDVSEIRSAEKARAEMVDYLSHDLRSPLVSALSLLGSEEGVPDERRAEHDGPPTISSNIRRSLAMMDELLDIARADSLREDSFSEVLLDAVLDNALATLVPQARASDIRFDVDGVDEGLWMSGDASSLERAIGNIVGNAIKYSNAGATVRVRLYRDGDEAALWIDDDGVGIDPDVIGELFTRFRRDARVAGRIKGTGLGLAFVARVVRQHAGTVEASSEPGRGTRVTLRLPLERVVDPESADAATADDRPGGIGIVAGGPGVRSGTGGETGGDIGVAGSV